MVKKIKTEIDIINDYKYIKGTNQFITIYYNINKNYLKLKIFGKDFVKHNRKNCIILYNKKEYNLSEYLEIEINNNNSINNNILELKLVILANLTNMNNMFGGCENLISLPDISNINTSYVYDMSSLFYGCKLLSQIDNNISKWNTSNVEDLSYLFYRCSSLTALPDISEWNTSKVIYIKSIFCFCEKLKYMPDISKWNVSNVYDMSSSFHGCSSLKSLPDISKWDISNITYFT